LESQSRSNFGRLREICNFDDESRVDEGFTRNETYAEIELYIVRTVALVWAFFASNLINPFCPRYVSNRLLTSHS
jgi:hypothetical protein